MNRCESRDVSVTVHGDKVRDVGEYSLMAQLGKGGFSVVRHAIHRGSHKEYACKILDQEKMNAEEAKSGREAGLWKKSLCLEIACMKLIKHRNIVAIEDIKLTDRYVYLFLELSECGTLFDRIKQCEKAGKPNAQGIPEEESSVYAAQIVCGLRCIHGCGVAHRDLKPDNILLNKAGVIKITDFGLCRLHKDSTYRCAQHELEYSAVGTLQYLPPECLKHTKHDAFKADLWSFGVVIYVMITGKFPFYHDNPGTLQELICAGESSIHGLSSLSNEAEKLVRSLVQIEPDRRAPLADVWCCAWLELAVRDLGEVLANDSMLPVAPVLYKGHNIATTPLFPGAGKTLLPKDNLHPALSQASATIATDRRNKEAVMKQMIMRGVGGDGIGVPPRTGGAPGGISNRAPPNSIPRPRVLSGSPKSPPSKGAQRRE